MFKKVRRYLKSPYYAFGDDLIKTHPHWMSDKYFIKVFWKQMMGYPLDLKHPRTFNEKLQWLKLYDSNPLYADLVDKLKVKDWVAQRIGKEHVIPTLAIYDNVDEIRLDDLPNQFVLKCNHDSGGVVICKDKSNFDFESAKRKLKKNFEHNFYWDYRERPYKTIDRKVFAEPFIQDGDREDLPDFKFFTFGGRPRYMFVASGRQMEKEVTFDFFDMQFNPLHVKNVHPNSNGVKTKPSSFEIMKELATVLSFGFNQVRVDFYEANGKCIFGEMTFYHGAGFMPFEPFSFDETMGELIELPI